MAIEFARSERISRGKGGNAVRLAAYVLREKLRDERTGETHKFKDDGTLQHADILLPDGTDSNFLHPGTLFNAIEGAEIRKDAQVAQHVVLALEPDISPAERIEMANGFAQQLFVDKGRPVLVALHSSADGGNPHAHLLAGTRQLGPAGFAPRKDRATAFIRVLGRAAFILQSERERVGELWRDFQNAWFAAHGKAITVDPVAPIPGEHLGPKRFRHPEDHRLKTVDEVRELNTAIARNPEAVAAHLSQQQQFDGRALDRFLTKHLPPEEREAIAADVRTRLHNLQREALAKASWSDKNGIGGPLSIEAVARTLDPKGYGALIKRAAELREQAAKEERSRNWHDLTKQAAPHRIAERKIEMGVAKRVAHLIGKRFPSVAVLRDVDLDKWSNMLGAATYMADNKGIKKGGAEGELAQITRVAESMLDPNHELGRKIRPSGLTLRQEAERELQHRQKIARNARETLDTMARDDKLVRRARRSMSM